jgi:hypothetical protein
LLPWLLERLERLKTQLTSDYFQGVGGGGAPPFFHGVGGGGAPPFFHGVGGGGAPPLAMITVPSLCEATAVFRPMAPTKTNMARNTTASLRDIECLRDGKIPRSHSIPYKDKVKHLPQPELKSRRTTCHDFARLSPRRLREDGPPKRE